MHNTICNVQKTYRMTVSKTKSKLVDVARQLFAKMGVDNTTMNDIAIASKKGRRTLYTYFSCKEDIYMAVIESELEILYQKMKEVTERKIAPDVKIIELIYTHLEAIKEVVFRNGTLKANFFRDIWSVEKVRKKFDLRNIALIRHVLEEGEEEGVFHLEDIDMIATLIHYCVKGIEVPYIRGQIGQSESAEDRKRLVTKIVFGALKQK